MVALRTRDQAKAERAYERELRRHGVESAWAVAKFLEDGEFPEPGLSSRKVTEFSRRSRARMVLRLCELDYEPLLADPTRFPGMVTLTYSGEWLAAVPDGPVAKAHFQSLCKRYERAWGRYQPCSQAGVAESGHERCTAGTRHWVGEQLACVWKHEFQGRGAPHFHQFMSPPHGRAQVPPCWHEARGWSCPQVDLPAVCPDESRGQVCACGDVEAHRSCRRRTVGAGLVFKNWLSAVWTDIVFADEAGITRRLADKYGLDGYAARALMYEEKARHQNSGTGIDYADGLRARDPKRLAVYFTKHGMASAKEYQHRVPEAWQEPGCGPGRFWGYRGLTRAVALAEITEDEYTWLSRLLRRYAAADDNRGQVARLADDDGSNPRISRLRRAPPTQPKTVTRTNTRTGQTHHRTATRRTKRFRQRSGWLSVNSGPNTAACLLLALRVLRADPTRQNRDPRRLP